EQLGDKPLQADLQRIRDAKTREDLVVLMGDRQGTYPSMFGGYIGPDAKDPGHYAFQMGTGGLGLPDRDYYLVDSPRFKEIRAKYLAYITQ
ncbi:M13 family metallopeptidase N-terminal domain-containing protein, partial [Acinetobacter baumannii]